jgi:diguanylate cyclase (GGDEF)-like protein
VDVAVAPIHDRSRSVTGAVLVLKDVTHERAHAAQLIHQARHDPLTGLVNRREFEQRLSHALASAADLDRRHAVLYMDLDNFKEVNDSGGHAAGDALLRAITHSLMDALRERDTLARLGGDEFGVLLENCTLDDAMRIAEKLRLAVAEFAFSWEGRTFPIGVSIGVVQVAGRCGSVADVLRSADASCYAAKHAGRNRVHLHDPLIGLASERR